MHAHLRVGIVLASAISSERHRGLPAELERLEVTSQWGISSMFWTKGSVSFLGRLEVGA
jgi:hypothetical protein